MVADSDGPKFRDEQCPKRGPGLTHTQDGSIYCTHCGTMVFVRGSEPGPFVTLIAQSELMSGKATCVFLVCKEKAEVLILLARDQHQVPVCYLCREDIRLAERTGLEVLRSADGIVWVNPFG